mgnify:FL=1
MMNCWLCLQSNQHHLLEEPRVIHPPVNIVALIENNGPLKVESEQPSPVSILDFPYEEEASVSREYKMNSDLQGEIFEHCSQVCYISHQKRSCLSCMILEPTETNKILMTD